MDAPLLIHQIADCAANAQQNMYGLVPSEQLAAFIRGETPELPQELIDHILGFLDDLKTLYRCCLVSKTFLPTSLSLIFHRLFVNPVRMDSLREQLRASPIKASAVRHLALDGFNLASSSIRFLSMPFDSLIMHTPSLETLAVSNTFWVMGTDRSLRASVTSTTATTLSLRATRFLFLSDLLVLLSAFPNLRKLTMDFITWVTTDDDTIAAHPAMTAPVRRLESLTVSMTPPDVVQWLFPRSNDEADDEVCLRNLAVDWSPSLEQEPRPWWDLIARAQGHLETLTVYNSFHRTFLLSHSSHLQSLTTYRTEYRIEPMPLPKFAHLRTLTLHSIRLLAPSMGPGPGMHAPVHEWLPALLTSSLPPTLEYLTLHIGGDRLSDDDDVGDRVPLDQIDDALGSRARLPAFKRVVFDLERHFRPDTLPNDAQETIEHIMRGLPVLRDQNAVEVKFSRA